jgi:hypothetical protein
MGKEYACVCRGTQDFSLAVDIIFLLARIPVG